MTENQRATADGVKVLHIVGSVRTGSTIVGNVLGELDGFFHVGELYNLWQNFLRERLCGCGRMLVECPIWSEVHRGRLAALPEPVDVHRWQQQILRARHLPRLLRRAEGPSRWSSLDAYRSALTHVYREAARAAGARVIVDSSKHLPHAAVAASLDEVQPYFIHLIRDPRGVAYSRQGSRVTSTELNGQASRRLQLARDGFQWVKINALTEVLRRNVPRGNSLQLRYEDFVENPPEALRTVLSMLREPTPALPPFDDGSIELTVNHTVGGNSIRFRSGLTRIELDTRWLAELDRVDRLVTGLAALPLLHRYGYRLDGSTLQSSVRPGSSGWPQEVDQRGKR
jgi:hypothetical protein